ncbi:MAG: lysophospholipid acyltransferase family protein [Myxococcota bacterium]|nr:lysophospholipid acyltransferase family protein [Myxococcota bacterium]
MLRALKNALIYHLTRVAVTLIGITPDRFIYRAGKCIGALAHRIAGRERRLARQQLSFAFRLNAADPRVRLLTRGVFFQLGLSAVELCRLFRSKDNSPEVIIPDTARQALDKALAVGRGVVFVTGHIGNWELLASALVSKGFPISTVVKESYDPRFTRLIHGFRTRSGVEAIYRGRPGSAVAMRRALKQGRILGFLIDQDTRVPSVFVKFFGRLAHTPLGAATFATRTQAPVVIGAIHRAAHRTHIVDIEQCPIPMDPQAATAVLTGALERHIRRHPSQWVWFHERWKTRPSSEALP